MLFFIAYIFGMSTLCVLLEKFTPMPSNRTDPLLALWALGMIVAGTGIGIIIPVAFLGEVLHNNFHPMWLYHLATFFGGVCGLFLGFRGRIFIAQLAMIGFVGFWVIAGVAFLFRLIFK